MENNPSITDWLEAAGAFAAVVVAGGAVIFAYLAWRENKKANAYPLIIDLFGEYCTSDMAASRQVVFNQLAKPKYEPMSGYEGLVQSIYSDVTRISHYYENLGVLVANGAVDVKVVAGCMGDAIVNACKVLGPFIYGERELRRTSGRPPIYQHYFEDLAVRVMDAKPELVRERLKRFPPVDRSEEYLKRG